MNKKVIINAVVVLNRSLLNITYMSNHLRTIKIASKRKVDLLKNDCNHSLNSVIDIREKVIQNTTINNYVVQRVFIYREDSNSLKYVGWVLDHSLSICMECNRNFSIFDRRHHCRACGNLVCSTCSNYSTILKDIPSLGKQRICKSCKPSPEENNVWGISIKDTLSEWGTSLISTNPNFNLINHTIISNSSIHNNITADTIDSHRIILRNKIENIAAQKIISLFRSMQAMNIRKKLEAQYPSLYLISIDKLFDVDVNCDLNAYVSGIHKNKNQQLETISISKLHMIHTSLSQEYALVAFDMKLEFISISVVKAKTKSREMKKKDPLGMVLIPIPEIPCRKTSKNLLYQPYKARYKLESSSGTIEMNNISNIDSIRDDDDDDHSSMQSSINESIQSSTIEKLKRLSFFPNSNKQQHQQSSTITMIAGSILVSIHTPDPLYSMCGWLNKKISTTKEIFESYYFILMHGQLSYYDVKVPGKDTIDLRYPKLTISCKDITAIKLCDRKVIRVIYNIIDTNNNNKVTGTDEINMKASWPHPTFTSPIEVAFIGRMWLRKLTRCCPQVVDPTLKLAKQAGYQIYRELHSIQNDVEITNYKFQLNNKTVSKRISSIRLFK